MDLEAAEFSHDGGFRYVVDSILNIVYKYVKE
jgi:hypothetical protein